MATSLQTAKYILDTLHDPQTFSVRRMCGEFCLYANGKPVGFVCDDMLFAKIMPASKKLEAIFDKGPCYPGSKDYYIITDDLLTLPELPKILLDIAASNPAKKR